MKIQSIFFFLFIASSCLFGQRKSLKDANFKVFLDADMGAFRYDDTNYFEVSAGVGYRFSEMAGAGLEYRRNNRSSCCNIYSMQGAGGFFRYQKGKIAGKVSGGIVFNGTRTWDGVDIFEYKNGGNYITGELKYYFWKAFRAGVYYTQTSSMNFDYYLFEAPGSTSEFTYDRVEKVSFPSFGISIGATLPPN